MHHKGLSLSVFINVAWIVDFTMCSTRYYRAHMSSSMNVKFNVTPLSTFTSTSTLACTQACIDTSACLSFNTGPGGRCELLDSYMCDGRGDLVSEVGFRYYDIDLDLGDGVSTFFMFSVWCVKELDDIFPFWSKKYDRRFLKGGSLPDYNWSRAAYDGKRGLNRVVRSGDLFHCVST